MTNETVTYETEASRRKAIDSADQSHWDHWINREQRDNHVPFQRIGKSGSVARLLKRAFDLIGAGIGTVLLLPLLAVICAAIKLTSNGPVFFRQQRYGLNGVPFTVLKFRTMHTHLCDRSGIEQTVANDPRITRVGTFLRKSNFDELPQLINVLKGDMSLVGPRPHVPGMLAAGMPYEIFDKRYMDRHQVRPGITGLAQVHGFRGETKDEFAASMRLELDLKYIETRSLMLDVKIVFKTIAYEFFTGNGY
ncbi:UDP-glucose:undecaprenyl-phosphate glucose-1-phosphate transferase [Roseibium album]|nr:UDP-glucose:undecaprenyl-phosphate glucose-1-phosphate transferase [Roseibium album]